MTGRMVALAFPRYPDYRRMLAKKQNTLPRVQFSQIDLSASGVKQGKIGEVKTSTHLITARFVYFLFYAAWAALLPFLPLFYKSKGFSGSQIGFLTGILPLVTLFGAPFWGGVADLTQQRKGVLVGVMLGVMASVALLMRTELFGLLALCVLAYAFFQSPIIPLIDTSVLAILGKRRVEYGRQRVWGAIGWGVAAPLAGWLTTRLGASFRFDLYLVLMGLCALAASRFPVAAIGTGANYWKGVGRLLADRRWFVFLLAVFVAGMSAGLVNNFLFLYMNELKSSETVMGLALTMATLSEAPPCSFRANWCEKWARAGCCSWPWGSMPCGCSPTRSPPRPGRSS